MGIWVENVVWAGIGQRNEFVDGQMPVKRWYPSSFCMHEQCWRKDSEVDSQIVELIFNTVMNAPFKDVTKFKFPKYQSGPNTSIFQYCTEKDMYFFMVKED